MPDVRAAQGAGVHVSHGVLHVHRDRTVDGPHHLQDAAQLRHPPGHDVSLFVAGRFKAYLNYIVSRI